MSTSHANMLISGIVLLGYLVVALFFLRFWTRSHDRLFALFSGAFAILAVQRLLLSFSMEGSEDVTHLYVLRLVAFLLILIAIIDKNRERITSR